MRFLFKSIHTFSFLCIFLAHNLLFAQEELAEQDSLRFPFTEESGGLYLNDPADYSAIFDPATGYYIVQRRMGDIPIGDPIYMTREEYQNMLLKSSMSEYYKDKSQALDAQYRALRYGEDGNQNNSDLVLPSLEVKSRLFETIFGGRKIELIPRGFASLDLGVFIQKLDNPQILPQNRNTFAIDLQQRIQMSVLGKVGENLQLQANYDTQAGFGFENRMNLGWRPNGEGGEDNIIKNIEFGNVSMPLSTSLITGAQSLFGVKGEFQFGKTYLTTVFSQQQSEARNITVEGGGVVNTFKIFAKDYEINQHYFLGEFFRDSYDGALENYPFIASQINITRLQVWVIDRGNANQNNRRSVVALRDIGNQPGQPTNGALYNQVSNLAGIRDANTAEAAITGANLSDNQGNDYFNGEHFIVHENVRLLQPNEYKFYPSLGYISLNQPLNDNDLLAVSFQYTDTRQPGQQFTVGEFSDQQSEVLLAKLLKSNTLVDVNSPMWDLMMKNIYSLETLQLSPEDFRLNVFYQDPEVGSGALNYLQNTPVQDQTLLQVLNMDRLNLNGQVQEAANNNFGDGLFDYVPGITIDAEQGRVIFTTVEPFAQTISQAINDPQSDFVVNELYDELPITFEQDPNVNRYFLEGSYKSEGGDGIPLGAFNVPQGSVRVTANGQELVEGVDYIVDYQLGRVNIINQTLKDSGVPINISLENQSTFNLQRKRFMGLNVEHRFSDKFIAGATFLNYTERPLTQKAQYNAEPVSNSIVGANLMYNDKSEFLTRLTDKIPLIDTETESQINFTAEAAYLIPGVNDATDNQSYIDDFEESQSKISLMDVNSWRLAATPVATDQSPNPDFPANVYNPDDFNYNFNRRLISWYNIDPRFYNIGGTSSLSDADLSNHASRRVRVRELYSNRDLTAGNPSFLNTFDIAYYPNDRGPYNLNPNWETELTTNRWGGMTRPLNITNFVQSNIEYVEFWMMDPYLDGNADEPDGKLLLHIGNVSEDILRDGNLMYENGINQEGNDPQFTDWGQQPSDYPILYSFENEGEARTQQDTGYDGLLDDAESVQPGFDALANEVNPVTNQVDPAADNFLFYLDEQWDNAPNGNSVTERFKYFRNPQGNSPSGTLNAASATPDAEDANDDYNLDRIENYNQYTINLRQQDMNLNNPLIVDSKTVNVTFENGQTDEARWYLFRIPVSDYDTDAGAADPSILTAARYMRLIMKGFQQQTTLRFGTFDMVRSDWRRYARNIAPDDSLIEGEEDVDIGNLAIGNVNIEENSTGTPPYLVPPGIVREELQTSGGLQSQNEASMVMNLTRLNRGDARGVFKNTNLDLRRYKRLRMFTHVHFPSNNLPQEDALRFFIRIGSDLSNNYYEYEFPMEYTNTNASTPTEIWPENNMIDINTDLFVDAKKAAYEANNLQRFQFVIDEDLERIIYVKGRPSLGNVSTIMLGVRNYDSTLNQEMVVWVNELRLSEIENEGGYAANANLAMTLGDFAQINASGSISSVGFGAIDRGPVERQQEEIITYNINTSVNLDKFLPEKWGLKIPFNYTISEQFIDPKFNPLDNDIEFDEDPNREELQDIVRTYSKQTTYAFSNIRKERVNRQKKQRFYDIENFSASFLYATDYYRDIYTKYNKEQNLQASLNYNYSFKNKTIRPFQNWRMVHDTASSAKYLKWIKEFNFNLLPTRISFRTDVIRTYNEQQYRDINSYLNDNVTPVEFNPIFSNNFLFNWQYNIGFDLTKSLRIDYNAATRTLNDFRPAFADDGLIFENLFEVGRPVNYNHQLRVNWKTPIHLFPYMDWMNVELGYTAQYDWQARLANTVEINGQDENLGNLAQNAQTWTAVGTMDFDRLYMNFPGFQRLDSLKQARKRELDSINRSYEKLAESKRGLRQIKKGKVKLKNKYKVTDYLKLALTSIRRGQFNYNRTSGIILPGLLAEPNFFGQGANGPGPTSAFLFGSQFDIRRRALENGWVTNSEFLTEPYTATRNSTFTANLQVEPSASFRIDFNAQRNFTRRLMQSGFNTITANNNFGFEEAYEDISENFTISTISVSTAFDDAETLYESLVRNARIVSQELGAQLGLSDTDGDGFAQGFGLANAEVLVPAFLATYQGSSVDPSGGYKKKIPLPNWNATYTGLINLPFFKKRFSNFEVSHAYQSSYNVTGVQNNLNRFADPVPVDANGNAVTDIDGNPVGGVDGNGNIFTQNTFGGVSMVESFAPLVGVDMTFRNSLQIRAQYNRDRIVALSLSNFTLTEDEGSEFIVGMGYTLKDVKLNMRYMGKKKTLKGDLNLRADLRMRDNETRIRRILEDDLQVTGGQNIFSLQLNAQYLLSKNLNVSFFYDQQITKYKISTAFPLSTVRAGFNVTFTFN